MKTTGMIAAAVLLSSAGVASAQSLFVRPESRRDPAPAPSLVNDDLRGASLYFVEPTKPPTYKTHDLITIIVDESSQQTSKQTLDTKKDYDLSATVQAFLDLQRGLEGDLVDGVGSTFEPINIKSKNKLKNEGTYDRSDRFQAKITAEIIDVKPNGTLVLEARKTRQTDEEIQTIVLSGTARQHDITSSNTVLSSQLADLTLVQMNEGQVKETASKGWIPRVLEAIFSF